MRKGSALKKIDLSELAAIFFALAPFNSTRFIQSYNSLCKDRMTVLARFVKRMHKINTNMLPANESVGLIIKRHAGLLRGIEAPARAPVLGWRL